jgi:hypothetical protein
VGWTSRLPVAEFNPLIERAPVDNDIVKRLLWSGLLAALGAAASVAVTRTAAMIWRRIYDEDPPE